MEHFWYPWPCKRPWWKRQLLYYDGWLKNYEPERARTTKKALERRSGPLPWPLRLRSLHAGHNGGGWCGCAIARDEPSSRSDRWIRMAAAIHDLARYPFLQILSKRQNNTIEFSLIKTILNPLRYIEGHWLSLARCQNSLEHHEGWTVPDIEWFDGNNMLLESRILAVADVVESMASYDLTVRLGIDAHWMRLRRIEEPLRQCCRRCCLRLIREKGFQLNGTWF